MPRRSPTAMPTRRSFTRSIRSRARRRTSRQGLAAGDPEWRCRANGSNSLAPQTDEYQGAEPGPSSLPAARGDRAVRSRSPTASRSSRAPATRGFRAVAAALRDRSATSTQPSQPVQVALQAAAAAVDTTRRRLVAAVKQLQADFGFKPDGMIGGDTHRCAERRPRLSRPPARRRDGAAALAAARSARDPDRRQHRRLVPRLLARRAACRSPQGRRRRSRQADAAASGADLPAGRQPDLDRARRASARRSWRTRAQAWLARQRFRR